MSRLILVATALLALVACNPGDDEGGSFALQLSGDNEVCEGDSCGGDGTGTAIIDINPDRNEVCYQIGLRDVEDVTGAHIHVGDEGETGDVLVNLRYSGDNDGGEDCVDDVDEAILEQISEDPAGHYLNVHSERYPDGAVRAQLG